MYLKSNLKEEYSPLYFLASLGSGGLGVSVFMYFMFMIEHPTTPMTTLYNIYPGVAFFVFGMFFIYFGLLKNEVFEIFSLGYFIVLAPFLFIQIKTMQIFYKLSKKLLLK